MKFNTIRFKIGILYIAILGTILIIYSSFLYLSLHYTLYNELDNELSKKAQEVASTIDAYAQSQRESQDALDFAIPRVIGLIGEYPNPDSLSQLERQWLQKVDKLDLQEDYISLLNIKGEYLAKTTNLQTALPRLSQKEINELREGNSFFKSLKFEKRDVREINAPFAYLPGETYIIQVVTSLKPVIHLLQVRLMHIAISIPVVLLFASFFARLFATRILKPVMEITRTASSITHKDLSARVRAEHIDEEMKYLVDSFNDMISRLEQSFAYITEFSSHVAHDLKTPLAIIKGESDIALRKDRNAEEYKRVLKVNLEETERMLRFIDDLLLLTKLDYRPEFFKFEQFDFIEFLWEIYEQSKILASQKDIEVKINLTQEQISVTADKLHLRRLFFNIMDNAIKFTPAGGGIYIEAKRQDGKIIVAISDSGIGITQEDLPRIFEMFYHVDKTGDCSGAGTGLGLSIAKSIAKLHRGNIQVKSTPGKGSTFSIILPLT